MTPPLYAGSLPLRHVSQTAVCDTGCNGSDCSFLLHVTITNNGGGISSFSTGAPPGSPAWGASCCVTRNGEGTTRLALNPASFFEKKQTIDNATKVANFGTLYWAHLRLGRLNRPKFYCVRGGFRR